MLTAVEISAPAIGRKRDRASERVRGPVRSAAAIGGDSVRTKQMGTITIPIPLVTWRDGRPRFFASAAQRKLGFRGEDLRHGPGLASAAAAGEKLEGKAHFKSGAWFTLDECLAWSKQRLAEIEAMRQARAKAVHQHKPRPRFAADVVTVSIMVARTLEQDHYQGKSVTRGRRTRAARSPHTVRQYNNAARALEHLDAGEIWHQPAAAISPATLEGVLEKIEEAHGLATARSVRALLSVAWKYGCKKLGLTANPVIGQLLPVPPPRVRYGEREEIAALVDASDRLGLPEIGDAILLGVWTGQRQADRLSLTGGQIIDGSILFRQQKKHGQPLLIPVSDELATRLDAARDRRRGWTVTYPNVVLDERARKPFRSDWYRKLFRIVCAVACAGALPTGGKDGQVARGLTRHIDVDAALAGFAPVPTLIGFRDQDLRDTAVTWLALSGCDMAEIASITGHSLKTVQDVLKHYLGMHPELARSAIAKLSIWAEER